MKIAISKSHAGYSLSKRAMYKYAELKGITLYDNSKEHTYGDWYTDYYTSRKRTPDSRLSCYDIRRDDPALVETIESLRSEANGELADIRIVEIPDDVDWVIEEDDGVEWVAERHRTWG